MSLYDMYTKVETREDFINLLDALIEDCKENKATLENNEINYYLIGMWGYIYTLQKQDERSEIPLANNMPSWKTFSQILLASVVYE